MAKPLNNLLTEDVNSMLPHADSSLWTEILEPLYM